MKTSITMNATNNTNAMPFPTNETELKLFIEAKGLNDGRIISCQLYENGFQFQTKKQGFKLYNFDGVDLIGAKAVGRVLECYLYDNGFKFYTKIHGWQTFEFDQPTETPEAVGTPEVVGTPEMALPTNKTELKLFIEAKGLNDGAVTWCYLHDNGFRFETEMQGYKLYNLNGVDLIGGKAEGLVTYCYLHDNGFKFETKIQGYKLYNLDGVDLIGGKAEGLVTYCYLLHNEFTFYTKIQGLKLYNLDGVELIEDKAIVINEDTPIVSRTTFNQDLKDCLTILSKLPEQENNETETYTYYKCEYVNPGLYKKIIIVGVYEDATTTETPGTPIK